MKSSERLVETIKKQQLRPRPKGYFLLRETLLWLGFALTVVFGALAFAVILFAIQQTDFYILRHFSHSRLELFLGLLPFIWIGFLAAFLLLSMYSVRQSARGYKYTWGKLAAYNFALSILLGTAFFMAGGAHALEEAFADQVPTYQSLQEKKVQLWTLPEQGYLSGSIVRIEGDVIRLEGFDGKAWDIHIEQAFITPAVRLEQGESIKIIGERTAAAAFSAREIRPWGGGPHYRQRGR